ncbi:MAG: phosphoribosylglycinamide formyltransferase [Planctomycetota bacterium]|jgi:formyltetrahydrofolate-dependent phosphoribosylglycinamide formyltransferase|nr:phosphoribosylglycinamide formyltransferase [Planctomycetota bacterium]
MTKRLKAAVLLSGGGGTLKNLLDKREAGRIPIDVELVVSSRPGVKGLDIARDAGIRAEIVSPKDYAYDGREAEVLYDWERMSKDMDKFLLPEKFDLVCMAGYLSRYLIPKALSGKVLNIHPSLIPMFCGQGMYGMKVHRAVVASGVKITGCTVHLVNNEYDAGPIVLQRACPVYSEDTPEDIRRRVFKEECIAYPHAINLFAEGRIRLISDTRAFIKMKDGKGGA